MKGINVKELCKLIRADKKQMIWARRNGIHYITNRHWMVRFDELPREVLVTMFSIFAVVPEENQDLSIRFGNVYYGGVDVKKVYESLGKDEGEITKYLETSRGWVNRIIKFGKSIIRINEEYMKIIEPQEKPICSNPLSPVSFLDGAVIILPVRVESSKEDDLLHDLLAS